MLLCLGEEVGWLRRSGAAGVPAGAGYKLCAGRCLDTKATGGKCPATPNCPVGARLVGGKCKCRNGAKALPCPALPCTLCPMRGGSLAMAVGLFLRSSHGGSRPQLARCLHSGTPAPTLVSWPHTPPTAGKALCGNVCINLSSDQESCGACGNVCGIQAQCIAGVCTCPEGEIGRRPASGALQELGAALAWRRAGLQSSAAVLRLTTSWVASSRYSACSQRQQGDGL